MNVNRIRHLENALNHFEKSNGLSEASSVSIDSHLRGYFRAHKGKVFPKDKEWISEKFKDLYRWRSLVDHFSKTPTTANDRLRTYFGNQSWRSYADSKTLPDHVRISMPEALFTRLSTHYGKAKALDIGRVWNESSPTFVRVNSVIEDRENVLKALTSRGVSVEKCSVSEVGLKINHAEDLRSLPEFEDKICGFQDESCQIVGAQVAVTPGEKVLDFCAGSGGKSLIFAPYLEGKGHLFLHDVNSRFLVQARHKMQSAGIRNFTCVDSNQLKKLKAKMDWVLVDVPSTGTGHYRRYPDRKWLYTDKLLEEKVQIQREIFLNALKYLKRGGKMVYATSSILPEENAEQIKYFCEKHKLYLTEEPVYALPHSHGMDGFFTAILEHQ